MFQYCNQKLSFKLIFSYLFIMDSCSKSVRDSVSPFDCILFDLDDTLYPSSTGINQATKRNIEDFLVERCGFAKLQASTLRVELFKTYGSTLAGLRALGYDISGDEYHSFIHGRLPYDSIKPNPQLRKILKSIQQRKIIFTNSDKNHARKALDRLGIRDCFEKIICFETLNPNLEKSTCPEEFPIILKPSLESMKIAIDVAEIDPSRTLFLDDSVRNVASGKDVGFLTALVGQSTKVKEGDYALENINKLKKAIPEIWFQSDDQSIIRTSSQIDLILATAFVGA